ncbi:MAG: clostripain-related cysteine peptidase [Elusimicrobiota bacterium]|nr:clostripain-related cysteine peptidase [Elusimicrobiota bacterium]
MIKPSSCRSVLLLSFLALPVVHCFAGTPEDFSTALPDSGRLSDFLPPAPQQAADPGRGGPSIKEWTIMVFMNSKNNLEQQGLNDINEMEAVGSTDKLNIVVEAGRMAGYAFSDGDWTGTRRYLIRKDSDDAKVTSETVEDLGKVDMGDYKALAAFGQWAKEKYPARKYMLIVWNHGSGWEKGARTKAGRGISFDSETGNHLTTPQLGQALSEIGKVDVFATDACLMQMAEVGFEIKDYADYIVGSEETEPGDGYDYAAFLAPLAARPEVPPADLARQAVDSFVDQYKARNKGATQSVLKAAALSGLPRKIDAWVGAVMAAGLKKEAQDSRAFAGNFALNDNKDLSWFVRLVGEKTKDPGVGAAGAALIGFIDRDLVLHSRYNNEPPGSYMDDLVDDPIEIPGIDYSQARGLAVYLPGMYSYGEGYSELAWARATRWNEFVHWYRR